MTTLTFLKGFRNLSKTFKHNTIEPYPLVKRVTSVTADVATIADYCDAIKEHASLGMGLLKGSLKEPLKKQSKKNMVENDALTNTLVLDIDGLSLGKPQMGKWDAQRLIETAEEVLSLLPKPFQETQYVVCASSSCGIKNDIRIHVHFILDGLYAPRQLKTAIRWWNLVIPEIRKSLGLTATGKALKNIIDPCLADNTRIVFIAPPSFEGVADPFDSNDQRVALQNTKPYTALSFGSMLSMLPPVDSLKKETEKALRELHHIRGTDYQKEKMVARFAGNNEKRYVMANPDKGTMVLSYCNDQYAYYNINGGDSNAYYVPLSNPEIVYNFKSEPPFLFKELDRNAYEAHKKRFKNEIRQATVAANPIQPRVYMVGDDFYCPLVNEATNEIKEVMQYGKLASVKNMFANHGLDIPEIMPIATLEFTPSSNDTFRTDEETGTIRINQFRPTVLMKFKTAMPIDLEYRMNEPEYEVFSVFKGFCPTLSGIIKHMLGDDEQCCNHFLNWLGYVWKKRQKPETCWLAQGTQGTGKGLFFRRIIQPMFGQYAQEKMLDNLEDNFTGWIGELLFLMVDEASNNKANPLKEKLKHWISEPTITVRQMRKDQEQIPSYFATMMLTNERGAATIEEGDRRYNVAPRQEVKIQEKFPEINRDREGFDARCDRELTVFVMLLNAMKVNDFAAKNCLENAAKEEVRESAMSVEEQFFTAVLEGNLEYLTGVLYLTENSQEAITRLQRAQGFVRKFIAQANQGVMKVPLEHLRHIYAAFEQREVSSNLMGRLCKKHNVKRSRASAGMNVKVSWVLSDECLSDMMDILSPTEASKLPNITPPKRASH